MSDKPQAIATQVVKEEIKEAGSLRPTVRLVTTANAKPNDKKPKRK